jgi:hypothetical protein
MAKKRKRTYDDVTSTHPVLCPDGKYRWVFSVPMLKNPCILIEVYWVLAVSFGIVWLFVMLIGACENSFNFSRLNLWGNTYPFLILIGVFFVIGLIGYLFVAWRYGWHYSILFIMDEKEVVHKQLPGTESTARAIGKLTSLAGAAAGRPGVVGMGILAANRTSMSSSFDSVRRIIRSRSMNLIKVRERFSRNMVFADDDDYDFVYQYICDHCPGARKS